MARFGYLFLRNGGGRTGRSYRRVDGNGADGRAGDAEYGFMTVPEPRPEAAAAARVERHVQGNGQNIIYIDWDTTSWW